MNEPCTVGLYPEKKIEQSPRFTKYSTHEAVKSQCWHSYELFECEVVASVGNVFSLAAGLYL